MICPKCSCETMHPCEGGQEFYCFSCGKIMTPSEWRGELESKYNEVESEVYRAIKRILKED